MNSSLPDRLAINPIDLLLVLEIGYRSPMRVDTIQIITHNGVGGNG